MTVSTGNQDVTDAAADRSHDSTRVAVIVASVHHGNTLQVARTIADELNADLLTPEQLKPDRLADYDLIGFGSGIYFGRHHRSLRRLAHTLAEPAAPVFLFSTSGLPFLARLFHWSLRRTLTRQSWKVIGEFNCRGWDTVGPLFLIGGLNRRHPDSRDLRRASSFARDVAQAAGVSGNAARLSRS